MDLFAKFDRLHRDFHKLFELIEKDIGRFWLGVIFTTILAMAVIIVYQLINKQPEVRPRYQMNHTIVLDGLRVYIVHPSLYDEHGNYRGAESDENIESEQEPDSNSEL